MEQKGIETGLFFFIAGLAVLIIDALFKGLNWEARKLRKLGVAAIIVGIGTILFYIADIPTLLKYIK